MLKINQKIEELDEKIIKKMKVLSLPFARFAIFVVYFWFGILKLFSLSPANPLVAELLIKTLPGVSFESFIVALGAFEIMLAFIFIIPYLERLAIFFLGLHLIMVLMPLILVPSVTWQSFLVPTLEGQYIIKNILIIAIAMVIAASLHPFSEKNK